MAKAKRKSNKAKPPRKIKTLCRQEPEGYVITWARESKSPGDIALAMLQLQYLRAQGFRVH